VTTAALADPDQVLVHFDYDLAIGHNLSALYCLGQNAPRGVATFHFPCWTDRGWTKRELADAFNATDQMLDTAQLYAGLVVLRKMSEPPRPSPNPDPNPIALAL
jgi:hypothetical protein